MAVKVTLDTNVYVSAFQFGGMRFLHMAVNGDFEIAASPAQTLDVVKEDEPDNRILECAAESGSDFIISADKDLLRLGSYAGASIVRAADFLRRREEQRGQ